MVINHLLAGSLVHALDGVEGALKVAIEAIAGLHNGLHDVVSLLLAHARSQREGSEVSADADAGRDDHFRLISWQRGARQTLGGHAGHVSVGGLVAVVVLDDAIEQLVEAFVRVSRAGVNTDMGVSVLAAREDALLEGHTSRITLVLVLVPHSLSQVLLEERVAGVGELREVDEVVGAGKVFTALGPLTLGLSVSSLFGRRAAHSSSFVLDNN